MPICCEGCFNLPRRQGLGHSNIFTKLEIRLSSDGDLNLDTSVDVDNDLLDDLSGGVEATDETRLANCVRSASLDKG